MPKHAILSASSSNMWLNCTPSIRASENIPNITSSYAEEGTLAHAIGELKLRLYLSEINKKDYQIEIDFLTKNISEEIDITEMLEYTQSYADFVIEHFNTAKKTTTDAKLILEQRLDFSHWVPDGFGTGDAVIVADDNIEIIDLKYGKGVAVSAKNNPQLRLYALGALNEYLMLYDIKNIAMTIYQPRLDSITTDIITVEELIEWAEDYVKPKAELAFNGDGEFVAGDHCKFCKIKSNCRANAYEKLKLARYDFQESSFKQAVEDFKN